MALCLLAIALGLGYWSVVRGPALARREENPRLVEAERRIRRGDILDRQGRALAYSAPAAGGVWNRIYPEPSAAPVVGYASIDLGTGGIEAAFDAQLRGTRSTAPLTQIRDHLLHLYPVGTDVRLTLDRTLQHQAAEALGIRTGAVAVLDVQSGEIVALASRPTFDPNTLEEDWPRLQFSPDKPMLNRATQGLYPPGLVFETLTVAAVLEDELATPTTPYTDELGVVLDVEPPISCPSDPPQVHFTLAEAYTWPCSVLFARLGLEMGGEQLADHVTRFGIGRPLDLPLEVATGQVLERGIWSRLLAARTAMGQGEVLVTPLELALAMAAIANDGVQPAPRLVLEADGEPYPAPAPSRAVLRPETARQVQTILGQAFAAGAARAQLPAADVAGRAGPAESGLPGAPPHAWFIGYAPASQPRFAIAVVVEHGSDGWETAAPIAIDVLVAAAALP
jgi:peptidoglycan glycosyltransferase